MFTLSQAIETAAPATDVEVDEVPIGLLAPTRPLVAPLTAHRNRRSLQNLAKLLHPPKPVPDSASGPAD